MSVAGFPDDSHVERIAEALWAREPIGSAALLIGAGFSRNAVPVRPSTSSMPGWNDIYKTMVEQLYPAALGTVATGQREWLLRQTGATSAYLRVAEEFEAQFGRDTLDKLILRHVPDQQFSPGKLHKMLVELPWADILTTNWDTLLERAGEQAEERVYDVLRTVEEIPEARVPRIVKLHGSFPSNRPFIFTEEDFRRYPERFAAFVNLAQQVAMENTLVLIGFSGDDPNFLFWSGWVRDRLGPKAPLIYLVGVLGLSPSKRKMLESRRIQPIDLAQLPQFSTWSPGAQMANAHQWFLERLRAAEPYPARRWPKPAAGFYPALELVETRLDPREPLAELGFGGVDDDINRTRGLVKQWRHNRSVYPGWVVAPLETSEYLWTRLNNRLHEIKRGVRAMGEDERLDALFELNWQLDVALIPLVLTIDDLVIELLEALVERYDMLSEVLMSHFRALALAIVRHAREEGDRALFERWSNWLEGRTKGDREAHDRLTYERILFARTELQIDVMEEQLSSWTTQGDSYWLLRKAGLLAEVGRDAEADELSAQALIDIRAQTARGKTDIAAWSRESFAMLVRVSVLQSEGGWAETQAARERFDMRQDQLAARGCPGKRDYFDLIDRLTQAPPPIRSVKESARQFDLGSTRTTHHLNGIDPRLDRLLAYQALRFQEETGLPVRLGNLGLSFPILTEAARWLMDIAPARAIDALLRASPGLTGKQFDSLLTRTTVARVGDAEAERLIPRLAALVASIRARISLDSPMVSYWKDRLKATLEIASRLILRAPNRAAEWLEIALSLQSDPLFSRRYELGTELQNLVNRAFEAARWADREDMLLKLFSSDIQPGAGAFANDSLDLAAGFSVDVLAFKPNPRWAAIIQATIDALRDGSRRKAASARLHWLLRCDLLDQAELLRAGEALWQSDFCEAGLPSGTIFWPASFLSLPHPKGVDPSAAFTARFLDGTPLTDAVVRDGNLAHAYQSSAFKLSEEQLIGEIERLRDFVADHPEAQPDPLDRGPTQLVDQTSRMAAALAKRAKAVPSAVSALSELTDSDRYPLRPEPAMAALVNVKILEAPTALIWLRSLFVTGDGADVVVLHALLDAIAPPSSIDDRAFEEEIWTECAHAIAARQATFLAPLLHFFGLMFCQVPDRLPAAVDDPLSIALGIILADTEMTSPAKHLQYDPYLVRYYSAFLARAMHRRGRGDLAIQAAWIGAIQSDPLPDTRRARENAEMIIARSDTGELDAG